MSANVDICPGDWQQNGAVDVLVVCQPSKLTLDTCGPTLQPCLATHLAIAGEMAICFCPVPFIYLYIDWLVLALNFQTVDLSRPLMDHHKICTQVWCGVKAENLFLKIFLPTSKNLAGGTSHFPQIIEDLHQPEARNFKTAQRIDKQITDVSSTINVLQKILNLGPSAHRVLMQPREKIGKL